MKNKKELNRIEKNRELSAYAAALSIYFSTLSEACLLYKKNMVTQNDEDVQQYFLHTQQIIDSCYEESLELCTILIAHMRDLLKNES
jgi:hypothetical protein